MSEKKELSWEELNLQNERLLAYGEIRWLASTYMIIGSNYFWKFYLRQYPDRPDAQIYMPFGKYAGKDGIVRCYMVDHGDPETEGYPEWVRGQMCTQPMSCEAIQIAEDGLSAQGTWVKTGSETYGTFDDNYDYAGNKTETDEASGFCGWVWGRYGIDFIKDEGKWKFLHLELWPLIMTHVTEPWTKQLQYVGLTAETTEEALFEPNFSVGFDDCLYPINKPYPPKPYKTLSETEHLYGGPDAKYLPEYDRF